MWNKPHHYRGYVCPHCGAPATFAHHSARLVHFLFWYLEIPQHDWIAHCSEFCDDFMADKVYTISPSLRVRKWEWRRYYEKKVFGIPDYEFSFYAKRRKEQNEEK